MRLLLLLLLLVLRRRPAAPVLRGGVHLRSMLRLLPAAVMLLWVVLERVEALAGGGVKER